MFRDNNYLKAWLDIKKAGFYDLPNENYTPLPIAQGVIFVNRILICLSGWSIYWLFALWVQQTKFQLGLLFLQFSTILFLGSFAWLASQDKVKFEWFVLIIFCLFSSSVYWRLGLT